jgi:hypothetical protein
MPQGFDEMAAAGHPIGIAMQISGLTVELSEAYDRHSDDIDQAADDPTVFHNWDQAEGESRAAILLNLAWGARAAQLREDDDSHGHGYAAELHRYAAEFTGDSEQFHGARFPLMPLPGQAGALASSLGFDRDDTAISLKAALILLGGVRQAG